MGTHPETTELHPWLDPEPENLAPKFPTDPDYTRFIEQWNEAHKNRDLKIQPSGWLFKNGKLTPNPFFRCVRFAVRLKSFRDFLRDIFRRRMEVSYVGVLVLLLVSGYSPAVTI